MTRSLSLANSWCLKCGENHRPTLAIPGLVDEDGEPACVEHQCGKTHASPPSEFETSRGGRIFQAVSASPVRTEAEAGRARLLQEDHVSRTCKVDGCKEVLGHSNISGFCRIHRPHKKVSDGGNPQAPPKRTSAANDSDSFVAERVTAFLTSLPVTDQRRLVGAWLEGRI